MEERPQLKGGGRVDGLEIQSTGRRPAFRCSTPLHQNASLLQQLGRQLAADAHRGDMGAGGDIRRPEEGLGTVSAEDNSLGATQGLPQLGNGLCPRIRESQRPRPFSGPIPNANLCPLPQVSKGRQVRLCLGSCSHDAQNARSLGAANIRSHRGSRRRADASQVLRSHDGEDAALLGIEEAKESLVGRRAPGEHRHQLGAQRPPYNVARHGE